MTPEYKKEFVTADLDVILHGFAEGYNLTKGNGEIVRRKFYVDTEKRVVIFEFTVKSETPDTVPA